MSSQTTSNGEQPSSKFINHVTSYPVVNDSIETFKQNPYGKKSLEIADGAYQKFGKPVEPYLQTPYSYAKPYVSKADELADSGLGSVESRFPIVKEDTHTVVDTAKSYAFWPFSYVLSTWDDEYKKTAKHNNRGPGITTSVMAIVSTELKIASDFFQVVADFLGPKYEEAKKKGPDYVRQAQDTAGRYTQIGQEKADDFSQFGQQKADEFANAGGDKTNTYLKYGQQKVDEAKGQAYDAKEQAKGQAYETKEQAKGQAHQARGQAYETKEQAKGQVQQTKEDAQKKTQSR